MNSLLIMGAGSVGCYLGGLLAATGRTVHFVGRPRVLDGLRKHGLTTSDLEEHRLHIPASGLNLHQALPAGLRPKLTLLCVKSGATIDAAQALQQALPAGSLVLSMQNGIGNAERAAAAAPALQWRAGMVPFNIAEQSPGHYHRGTTGALMVQGALAETALAGLQTAFLAQGIKLQLRADLLGAQWGKLLLNLNNPVNALSGLPLRDELLERGYRRCFAALQREALDLLDAAGMQALPMTPLPHRWLVHLLGLPTPIFKLLAASMLKIDAKASSSMADDLARGRVTEIDALCGEVIRLGQRVGRPAPLNSRMQEMVQAWPQYPQRIKPGELAQALGLD
jgi:2-dehydropantoate 2-reductase